MSYAIAAETQVVLEGVPLPARKERLLAYARAQDAEERILAALRSLPEREYRALDEVGEELARHAERNGADKDLVEALRGMQKRSFDGPNAVMSELKGNLTGRR